MEKHHSPEQIAGRLKKEKLVEKLSFKSIYNWIYKGLLPKISKLNLRRKGKKSIIHDGRGKIGGKRIKERPKRVNFRKELGHWEGDTIVGLGKRSSILTIVEKVSRYTYI